MGPAYFAAVLTPGLRGALFGTRISDYHKRSAGCRLDSLRSCRRARPCRIHRSRRPTCPPTRERFVSRGSRRLRDASWRPPRPAARAAAPCDAPVSRTAWTRSSSSCSPRPAPSSQPVAVFALGGYGRRELCLHSDIDLLVLFAGDDRRRRTSASCTRSSTRCGISG